MDLGFLWLIGKVRGHMRTVAVGKHSGQSLNRRLRRRALQGGRPHGKERKDHAEAVSAAE